MRISVMIATHNRSVELCRTLRVLAAMNPPPDEVLITADGCNDETIDVARRDYPTCRLFVNEARQGSVASRINMLRDAVGDVVVSLDDDSYPRDPDFFARLPAIFAAHPDAAVVSFPELRDDGSYSTADKTPMSPGRQVSAYANCAAAMRRGFYLESPGFPAFFGHMYEEPDFALQCYARGAEVWFEPTLTVRHHQSTASRQPLRRRQLNARNEMWSVCMRCPWPWLPLVALYRGWRQFRLACSVGLAHALREPGWWVEALVGMPNCLRNRAAIPWPVYYQWMRLSRSSQRKMAPRATTAIEAAATSMTGAPALDGDSSGRPVIAMMPE